MRIKKNLDEIMIGKMNSEIVEGKWTPGENLSLERFMETYGVSRTPVIQALKKLNAMGVVDFTNEGHFRVPEYTETQVRDICAMRLMLESRAIDEIEKKGIKPDFATLEVICSKSVASNDAGEVIDARLDDLEFHRTLVAQAGNECLSELFLRVQAKFKVANYLLTSYTHEAERYACEDHEEMIRDLKAGDFDAVRKLLDEHISGACAKILEKMANVA